jgi:iron complex outermembrane receptor protein
MSSARLQYLHCIFFLVGWILPGFSFAQHTISPLQQISGKVVSDRSGEPIAYAAVTCVNRADSAAINGALSDESGNFLVRQIRPGLCHIEIKMVGYQQYVLDSTILISPGGFHNFGTIRLANSGKLLNEITISSSKDESGMGMNKKVFYVDKDLNSEGGTAVDALKNIPSVSVESEGIITIRGNSDFKILIDGKISGMLTGTSSNMLSQIPVSSIEKIELITSPSAKYDPSGGSAILNIVLKKNTLNSWNAFMLGSYSPFGKGNVSLGIGYRNSKINFFANYSFRRNEKWYTGYTNRETILRDTSFHTNQQSDGIISSYVHLAKIGFEYTFNTLNTVSFTSLITTMQEVDNDHVMYDFLDRDLQLRQLGLRNMTGLGRNHGYDLSVNYVHRYDQTDRQLSFDCSISGNVNSQMDSIGQRNYTPAYVLISPVPAALRTQNNGVNTSYLAKLDYQHPLAGHGMLECGLQFSSRKYDMSFLADTMDLSGRIWLNEPALGNNFLFIERVYGAYAIWSKEVGRLKYQVGARAEDVDQLGNANKNAIEYHRNYFDIFPSGMIAWKITDNSELRFNAGKRTGRPSIRFLNPFRDYTDPLNQNFGNPNLLPEITHHAEISYSRYFKKVTVNGAAFFRYEQHLFSMVHRITDTVHGAIEGTYLNLGNGYATGLEATLKMDYLTWLSMSLNLNAFKLRVNGYLDGKDIGFSSYNFFLKMNTQISFSKKYTVVPSINYYGPSGVVQGTRSHQFYTDIAIRREFLSKKASLTAGLSDIFNTLSNSTILATSEFNQQYYKKKETRIFTLTLTYVFGAQKESIHKSKAIEEPPVPAILPPE